MRDLDMLFILTVPERLLQQLKPTAEWKAVPFGQDDLPEAAKEKKLQALRQAIVNFPTHVD